MDLSTVFVSIVLAAGVWVGFMIFAEIFHDREW